MNEYNKVVLAWSGGKDSVMALYELKRANTVGIAALLTTVTEGHDRISMHGVRRRLLIEQAETLGYPLEEITIPQNCPNDIYENRMQTVLERHRWQGISTVAFGDLFLEDIRSYREDRLNRISMKPVFPIWKKDTTELAHEFMRLGFRAIVICVDTRVLDKEFSCREYDEDFLKDLPEGIDPCGENGEFHSFVYDGPIFSRPVPVKRGEKVLRDERFFYCDIL